MRLILAALLVLGLAAPAVADSSTRIGTVDTTFRLLGRNDRIAVDRYDNAPGQQVAHHARTITMSDPQQLKMLIEKEKPHLVVPEIEAIATPMLEELEAAGAVRVIPNARAARLTMDREGIRRLAAETLGLATSPYVFCDSLAELQAAIDELPDAFREAVWLRDVEEFSYAEIASMLAIPSGTVMSRISRGRRMLFDRLQHLRPVNA